MRFAEPYRTSEPPRRDSQLSCGRGKAVTDGVTGTKAAQTAAGNTFTSKPNDAAAPRLKTSVPAIPIRPTGHCRCSGRVHCLLNRLAVTVIARDGDDDGAIDDARIIGPVPQVR